MSHTILTSTFSSIETETPPGGPLFGLACVSAGVSVCVLRGKIMADSPTTEAQDIVDAWKRIMNVTLKPERVQEHLDKLRKAGAIPLEKKSKGTIAACRSTQTI